MLTGQNGILTQANNSKIEQSHGAVKEAISLAYNEWQIEINTGSRTKLASTETVIINEEEEKAKAGTSETFLQFLERKGYIKENTTDVLDVEALTGGKQALGNGEDTDVYKIEEQDGKYKVNYYDKNGTPQEIWNMSSSSTGTETGGELELDTGKEALILVYNVSAGDTIELPYDLTWYDGENEHDATFNFTVDWGDGNIDTITNTDIESKAIHEYLTAGEKKITITGTFESIAPYNESDDARQGYNKLTRIEQWGTTGLKTVDLSYLINLTQIAQPTESSFKDLAIVRFRDSGIESIPDKMFLNCSKITSFRDVFYNCNNLETIGDYAFAGCNSVTSFYGAFEDCSNLQTIGNNIFENCTNVTNFNGAFYNTAITNIPENLFSTCTNVTDFSLTFAYTLITNIPENLFSTCTNVTDFSSTFDNTAITNIPENIFKNCTKVTDFSNTFRNTAITDIPEKLFLSCLEVKDFFATFAECENLTGVAPELWLRVPDGEENGYEGTPDGMGCFYGCENLNNYEQIPEYWKVKPSEPV